MHLWQEAQDRGLARHGYLLVVDATRQALMVWSRDGECASYPASTAHKGLGNRENSNQTPTGWHQVADRIGHGCRIGSVFVARRYNGEVVPRADWRAGGNRDLILTRILRLRGLEPGINCGPGVDSYRRFIYLHGTNQEQRLGRPASHGCIRLGNNDMLELFHRIRGRPTWCWIGQLPKGSARRRA